MTKANQLRQKLAASNNRISYHEAVAIIGGRNGMSNMLKTGEISIEGEGDEREIVLDPNYKTRRQLPIKRKAGKRAHKAAHKKRGRKPRSMKEIVAKHVPESRGETLARITLQNLIASTEHLAATLRREVDGVEANPTLVAPIETAERAAAIVKAA